MLSIQAERADLEAKASKAVYIFLADGGYKNLAEASDDLGLTLQELWDLAMDEAGIPRHEPPAMIQTRWMQ